MLKTSSLCQNKTNSFVKTAYRHFIFYTKYSSIYINTHRVIASLEVKYMDYVKLGEKIKRERIHNRLTQEMLAEMAEITSSYVGQIERGERKVTLSKLVRIANVLNVSVDYLLSDTIDTIEDDFEIEVKNVMSSMEEKDKQMVIDIIKIINDYKD